MTVLQSIFEWRDKKSCLCIHTYLNRYTLSPDDWTPWTLLWNSNNKTRVTWEVSLVGKPCWVSIRFTLLFDQFFLYNNAKSALDSYYTDIPHKYMLDVDNAKNSMDVKGPDHYDIYYEIVRMWAVITHAFVKCSRSFFCLLEYSTFPQYSAEYWYSVEYCGILWNMVEYDGISVMVGWPKNYFVRFYDNKNLIYPNIETLLKSVGKI